MFSKVYIKKSNLNNDLYTKLANNRLEGYQQHRLVNFCTGKIYPDDDDVEKIINISIDNIY